MRIGIDVDGVLIDFEQRLRCKAELFDYIERNNIESKNNQSYWIQEKYEWSKEEWKVFSEKYLVSLTKESAFLPGVEDVLELLKKDNNELIIISARGTEFDEMISVVEDMFVKNELKFDKCFWKIEDKLKICKEEHIDIMIDDNPNTCEKLSKNKIKTFYFRNTYGKELKEDEYLKNVYNWGHIYKKIKSLI